MNKKGFTLPEVLIAAAIFAFAIAAILKMFIGCAFLDQTNRNKGVATTHAEFVMEDIMEYMRNNTDSDPLASLQTTIDPPEVGGEGAWNWDSDTICNRLGCTSPCVYPCVLNNESIATSYNTNTTNPLEITVLVSWKDRAQTNTRSLELKTLISKR